MRMPIALRCLFFVSVQIFHAKITLVISSFSQLSNIKDSRSISSHPSVYYSRLPRAVHVQNAFSLLITCTIRFPCLIDIPSLFQHRPYETTSECSPPNPLSLFLDDPPSSLYCFFRLKLRGRSENLFRSARGRVRFETETGASASAVSTDTMRKHS